jgi:hypothetical protein
MQAMADAIAQRKYNTKLEVLNSKRREELLGLVLDMEIAFDAYMQNRLFRLMHTYVGAYPMLPVVQLEPFDPEELDVQPPAAIIGRD